jgi:hypothetical protein
MVSHVFEDLQKRKAPNSLYAMVIYNICIVRTLGKSHVVRPCQITLEVINGQSRSLGRKEITTMGKVCNLCRVL